MMGREGCCQGSVVTTDKLIEKVELEYGLRIATREVVKEMPGSSFVAKLVAEGGDAYALKSLFIPQERQRFIAESERRLADRGVELARPVSTKSGRLFIEHEGAPYVLYEWLPGEGAALSGPDDLLAIVELAARFHLASRDLAYPAGVEVFGHLDWREEYENRLKSMERWLSEYGGEKKGKKRKIANAVPFFLKAGKKALRELRNSEYADYVEGRIGPRTLVHGDLHNKNVILSGSARRLIDFEDVRFDAPSKDLIRIHSMYAKRRDFEPTTFRRMLRRYFQIHPVSSAVRRIIEVDLLFPHIFERTLRKKKYKKMSEEEIAVWLRQERRKSSFVRRLFFGNGRSSEKGGKA